MITILFILGGITGACANRLRGATGYGDKVHLSLLFAFVLAITSFDFITAFLVVATTAIGSSFGWGKYIGALEGRDTTALNEVPFIDKLIIKFKNRPKLWGFIGLSLRGLLWTIWYLFLASSLVDIVLISIAGLSMGICYYISHKFFSKDGSGWEAGEFIFGAIIWCLITLLIL